MNLRRELNDMEQPQLEEAWSSGYSPRALHGLVSIYAWWSAGVSFLAGGWSRAVLGAVGCLIGWHHFRLWRKIRQAERNPQTIDIHVHGRSCPMWREPDTDAEWLALELEWEDAGNGGGSRWRCPVCGETVIVRSNRGTLVFGVDP